MEIISMARNHVNDVPVRPDYFGPASYYPRRVDVGVRGVAAREAREQVAGLSVGLLGMAADAALPGGVSRVDVTDRKPDTRGLVSDLRLKVAKGPRVQDASLRPGSPYPCADTIEVFESDTARGAFGCSDDLLADAVIDVCGEAVLLEPTFAKQALRAPGALCLKSLPKTVRSAAERVEAFAGEVLPVARRSDVDDADVHAQPAENLLLLGIRDLDGDEEVEFRSTQHEVGLASLMDEKCPLVLSADERDGLPARERPEVSTRLLVTRPPRRGFLPDLKDGVSAPEIR